MNFTLLNPEIQEFINANIEKNISTLALQKNPFPEVNWVEILNQILAKRKAKDKLPTWFQTKDIIYPSKISVEQTSSEKTAQYKSTMVSGDRLIDLTGGFGVDDYYFSKALKSITHCEIDADLSETAQHNFEKLKVQNVTCIQGDSTAILKKLNQKFNWIYIDPSRRNETKGKVFMLKDCLPNVPELLEFYFNYTENILIKTAPILDITAGLSELKNVKNIHIVALDNEVKELLWELSKGYSGVLSVKTVNIIKEESVSKFEFVLDKNPETATFSLPKKYLFEPNSAIMKSGGFDNVSTFFKLEKLHRHSHLYTSDKPMDFPGRVFKIENCILYTKLEMKRVLENQKANLSTRNFPDSVESIRKKWKIKDGGNQYCFFTTDLNDIKIVLICTKINKP
ncbi:THUMP-like domain-containing protein [Flavobacterium psychrotolerans]|uniref:SAM-dependent methyltransferase n=1 Tax=Flavobacterium psychrotolerans TaxID=2169410 RepID=A0A2U1JGB1_9FLAO|nr:class I SAM-dependent methyltransferase [Flavobacterium psychrotolerans]PWA04065.1 SAM-dependent methyltransferase [Flavobacterium psychrotolerans]